MTETYFNKVYDLLVEIAGASESARSNFVFHHIRHDCDEWRFCGNLGFGGKYYSKVNRVDCYSEDRTEDRGRIIDELNDKLKSLCL